jgi:hypothetical protein
MWCVFFSSGCPALNKLPAPEVVLPWGQHHTTPHDFLSDEEFAGVSLDGHGMDSSVGLNLNLLIDSVRIDNIVGGLNLPIPCSLQAVRQL